MSLIEDVFQKSGGRYKLRLSLGLSNQSMSDWVRSGVIPVHHVPTVHALTGIPMAQLNPCFDVPAALNSRRVTDKAGA